jgi:hypothetical protein
MRCFWGYNARKGGFQQGIEKNALNCFPRILRHCVACKRHVQPLSLPAFSLLPLSEDSQPASSRVSLTVERLPFLDRFAIGITLAAIRLEDIANSGRLHLLVPLTGLEQACLGKFLFGPLPAIPLPIPKVAMPLYRLQHIACHTRLVKICCHGLDDERILGQCNRLVTTPKVPTGACRQARVRVALLRFWGRLGLGGVFQPGDAVVFIRLADDVPKTLFNNGPEKPTGVCFRDPQGMSNGGKKVNAVRRGVPDISALDHLLAELFTAGVTSKVFEFDVSPGGLF